MLGDIVHRTLNINQYTKELFSKGLFSLKENVICFFDGTGWNVVRLIDVMKYPVIYFEYKSDRDNKKYTNTLILCPITFRVMIFKDIISIDHITNDTTFLRKNDSDIVFSYGEHFQDDKKSEKRVLRRMVYLSVLKDLFNYITDIKYINIKNYEYQTNIIPEDYPFNWNDINGKSSNALRRSELSIHPKTIVHIIQYFSEKKQKIHYAVVIGKNANKKIPTGYDQTESGLKKYLSYFHDKLENKKAFIFPMFWFTVHSAYHNPKIINL
jgi:hypothetical protein